jgi:hypothetical protein
MLVAMALTLILVYAIAHFYAIIGDAVKDGRGMIEMNQQLRAVVQRLKADLDLVTIPAVPWADDGGASGYIYFKEGPASDWDVNGNYKLDADWEQPPNLNLVDFNGNGVNDWLDPNVSTMLGDCDDVIGMTIHTSGLPFTGLMPNVIPSGATTPYNTHDGELTTPATPNSYTLSKTSNPPLSISTSSPYAEVVWWTSFSDLNGNTTWDLNEPRFIHRRQLLIRPDLNVVHPGDPNGNVAGVPYLFRIPVPSNLNNVDAVYYYEAYQYFDISIHYLTTSNGYLYFAANSLADLAQRQNRFMHISTFYDSSTFSNFPYALDLNPNYAGNLQPTVIPDNLTSLNNTQPRHTGGASYPVSVNAFNSGAQYRWVLFDGGRKGEDVMLSNVLAFDVRIYDPTAIIRASTLAAPVNALQTAADPIQPGDPGYAYANANNFSAAHNPYYILGTGAFVDIGYGIGLANSLPFLNPSHAVPTTGNKNFALLFGSTPPLNANAPTLGSEQRFAGLPSVPQSYINFDIANGNTLVQTLYRTRIGTTWDSWTLAYERDGINQDSIVEGANFIVDEGTDGLDNDGFNGVDDAGERETVPPYAYPLRGVQIRIRLYEPGTRQVRQATVENDFISE